MGGGGVPLWDSVGQWPGLSVTSSEFSTQPAKCSKRALHWSDSSESLPHRASISLPEQGSSQELSLPPSSTYSTFPVHHLLFFWPQSSMWLRLHTFSSFPTFDLSILPVLISRNSTILLNPPMRLYTHDKPSGNTCSFLMGTEVKGVLENWSRNKTTGCSGLHSWPLSHHRNSAEQCKAIQFLFYVCAAAAEILIKE